VVALVEPPVRVDPPALAGPVEPPELAGPVEPPVLAGPVEPPVLAGPVEPPVLAGSVEPPVLLLPPDVTTVVCEPPTPEFPAVALVPAAGLPACGVLSPLPPVHPATTRQTSAVHKHNPELR